MIVTMKTLQRDHYGQLWNKYWVDMRTEWFKLEVLQDYTGEDKGPSLDAWRAGDKQKALKLLKSDKNPEFTAECQNKAARGVKLVRYHVIQKPLCSYLEWEIEFYKAVSIPLRGERVFLVDRNDLADLSLPAET